MSLNVIWICRCGWLMFTSWLQSKRCMVQTSKKTRWIFPNLPYELYLKKSISETGGERDEREGCFCHLNCVCDIRFRDTLHFWGPAQTFYIVFIPAHQKCRVSPGSTGMASEKVGSSEKWCASSAFGLKQINYREENAIYIVKKVVWLAL
jgi:hypothetical protein